MTGMPFRESQDMESATSRLLWKVSVGPNSFWQRLRGGHADEEDYYKILGVERGCSDDDVKKAYRRAPCSC